MTGAEFADIIGNTAAFLMSVTIFGVAIAFTKPLLRFLNNTARLRLKVGDHEISAEAHETRPEPRPEFAPPAALPQLESPPSGHVIAPVIPESALAGSEPAPAERAPGETDDSKPNAPTTPFSRFWDALNERRHEDAARISRDELEQDAGSREFHAFMRYKFGADPKALGELEANMATEASRAHAASWLAILYDEMGNLDRARACHEAAVADAVPTSEYAGSVANFVKFLVKTQEIGTADRILTSALAAFSDTDSGKGELYLAGAALERARGNHVAEAALTTKAAVLSLVEGKLSSWHFDAAYQAGASDMLSLSSFIYARIVSASPPNFMAMNNLAVAYKSSGISAEAVALYKRSMESGETLPAANFGYNLLGRRPVG